MSTVLIVDDDDALHKALATALSDLGHEPAEAADGVAALAWLVRRRADAVLPDLRMPGSPLRRIPAIVSFLNPKPALSLGVGNRASCPIADLRVELKLVPGPGKRPFNR